MSSANRGQNNTTKSKKTAEYLKDKKVMRKTGACPWGCGAQIVNGGQALMDHLNRCQGGGKRRLTPQRTKKGKKR